MPEIDNDLNQIDQDSRIESDQEQARITSELQKQRQTQGVVGSFFGDRENVPNNVMAIVAIIALGGLIGVAFFPKANHILEILKAVLFLVLGGLGARKVNGA